MPRLGSLTSQALAGLGRLLPPSVSRFFVDRFFYFGNEVAEGQDLNITLNIENVPDGTRLWWRVEDGGTSVFEDWFAYQGDFIVSNNTPIITVVPGRDELAENNESFRVVVRDNNGSSGPFLGRSQQFYVVDVPPNNLLITDFSNPFAGPANFPTGNSQILSGKGYVDTGSIFCETDGDVEADVYLIEFDVVTSDLTGLGFTGADADVFVTYNGGSRIQFPLASGSSGTQTFEIETTNTNPVIVEFSKPDAGLTVDNLWIRRKIVNYVYNGNFDGLLGWAINNGPGSARSNAFNRLELESLFGGTTVYQNVDTLEPNTTYRIQFEVSSVSGPLDNHRIQVYDIVNNITAYTFTPTGAEYVDVDFTTPPITQFYPRYRLQITAALGSIEVDSFSIRDTGVNFVTNGDFETGDLTGWNDDGLITASVSPDNTLLVSSQNATQLDQNLDLVAGRTYRIRFDILDTTGSTNGITIVNTFNSQPVWGYAPTGPETVSNTFTTNISSPPFYQLRIRPSVGSMELDNFIITEE
jgi:hypothetical protein